MPFDLSRRWRHPQARLMERKLKKRRLVQRRKVMKKRKKSPTSLLRRKGKREPLRKNPPWRKKQGRVKTIARDFYFAYFSLCLVIERDFLWAPASGLLWTEIYKILENFICICINLWGDGIANRKKLNFRLSTFLTAWNYFQNYRMLLTTLKPNVEFCSTNTFF